MQLSELISVAPRYARSVNLERDGFTDAAIDGYVVTATAEEFLLRFGRALGGASGHRAWTLTGPYGAGKSSFALFLANLFSPVGWGGSAAARRLLKEQHAETYQEIFELKGKRGLGRGGFASVLVSGAAEPLLGAVLRCTLRDISAYFSGQGRKPDALKELDNLQLEVEAGKQVSTTAVMSALSKLSESLISTGRSRGILLIVDELGKFLEYAARTQTAGDLFLLQQLAEATSRQHIRRSVSGHNSASIVRALCGRPTARSPRRVGQGSRALRRRGVPRASRATDRAHFSSPSSEAASVSGLAAPLPGSEGPCTSGL